MDKIISLNQHRINKIIKEPITAETFEDAICEFLNIYYNESIRLENINMLTRFDIQPQETQDD